MSSYQECKKEQAKEIAGETHEIETKVFVNKAVRIATLVGAWRELSITRETART
jgi:hypothetical protein